MAKSDYSLILPAYTVGPKAYSQIGRITRFYGKKVVIIGGKTALSKAKQPILDALKDTRLEVTDVLWYGGDSNYTNINALAANPAVQAADMVFGVGGGRAVDTSKIVADKVDKPFFSFPTVASNCAPVTAIGVVYNDDKSINGYYYLDHPPVHSFINTEIIVNSPFKLFWAGIGDAMSKEPECLLSSRGKEMFHTIELGRAISTICSKPLLKYGEKALADMKAHNATFEFEQVVLDIIVSTGLVSNCVTHKTDYYYNSSVAHLFYNASTILPQIAEKHLHGEVVSFGVLVLLTYDRQFELRDTLAKFYKKCGFPTKLSDLDIDVSEIDKLVAQAPRAREWTCVPTPMTAEVFKKAILDTDQYGKSL